MKEQTTKDGQAIQIFDTDDQVAEWSKVRMITIHKGVATGPSLSPDMIEFPHFTARKAALAGKVLGDE